MSENDIPETRLTILQLIGESTATQDEAWFAFDTLYRRLIESWCRRKLPDYAVEDVTQQIMIKLFHALPNHTHDAERGKFRSWLKTVAENCIRDFLRKDQCSPIGATARRR